MENHFTENEQQTILIHLLCQSIETMLGRTMRSPKEFDWLAQKIFEVLHESLSVSTLKRLWGYIPSSSAPSLSTLNLLSRFVQYKDFEDFCQQHTDTSDTNASKGEETDRESDDSTSFHATAEADDAQEKEVVKGEAATVGDEASTENEVSKTRKPIRWKTIFNALSVLMFFASLVLFTLSYHKKDEGEWCTFRKGQTFHSSDEYLMRFGVVNPEHYYDVELPGHRGLVVWTPTYRHPVWHNEGDSATLFPTITEYWLPEDRDATDSLVVVRNHDRLFGTLRTKEVRITFMYNLQDELFTFLGIYQLDTKLSDETKLVWKRVSGECDLSHLDEIEKLYCH